MDYRARRSNAQDKFQDEYRELFGDVPETVGHETSSIATESAYNFESDFHDMNRFDWQNSPAKRLLSDDIDFDPDEDEFEPNAFQDPLAEGYSALDAAKQAKKKKRNPDKLDEVIQKLQIMWVGYGFPEPGNLRSKNTKEVKKTIKCFSAILQQRENDLRFRSTVNERFRKLETELTTEIRKNQLLGEKKEKLNREVARSKNIISSTKDQIKEDTTKTKQEAASIRKLKSDLTHKLELLTKELKRKDKTIQKMESKMRDIIDKRVGFGRGTEDMDFKRYENSMEITAGMKETAADGDGNRFYKFIPERELMDMQKKGFEDNHNELQYENEMLRAWILMIQSELNNFMAEFIENMRQYDIDTKILTHLAFDKYAMVKIEPMQMSLPKKVNGDRVKQIIIKNVQNFKQFLTAYLSPSDVYTILAELNKDLDYENQVLTFDDLSMIISQWKTLRIK